MNSNTKLHVLAWIITVVMCAISWSLAAFGVIPIWGAIIIAIIAVALSPTIAWLAVAAFLRSRYLEFIRKAKNEQDELLARMEKRRQERRAKRDE